MRSKLTQGHRLGPVLKVVWQSTPGLTLAFRLEYEILTGAIRLKHDTHEFLSKLTQEIDWDFVFTKAIQHAIFPQLYHRLAKIYFEGIPREIFAQAKSLYLAQAQRNLRISAELLRILDFLESHGIPAMPFKGPVLAMIAYGDVTLRQFVDLDILVSRQDIMKAKDLLVYSGYRLQYPLTEKQEQVHLSQTCEFTFVHPRLTMLDIHWRFAAKYMGSNLDAETAFARRVPINLQGKTVYSLAPDDTLILLCYHGVFHLWPTLAMVSDVARLVKAQEPWDWPDLLQKARDLGMRRAVLLGLSLAGEVLSAPVPGEVLEEAQRDPAIVTLKHKVLAKLFSGTAGEQGLLEEAYFHLRAKERSKDRLRYISIRLAVPTIEDWQWLRLPDRCFSLYYLLRPLRLMMQGLVLPLLKWLRARLRN